MSNISPEAKSHISFHENDPGRRLPVIYSSFAGRISYIDTS
jgi:hypothetical protein